MGLVPVLTTPRSRYTRHLESAGRTGRCGWLLLIRRSGSTPRFAGNGWHVMDCRHGSTPSVQRALPSQHKRHLICRPASSCTARPPRSRSGSAAAPPPTATRPKKPEGARAAIPAASEGRGQWTQFADRAVALAHPRAARPGPALLPAAPKHHTAPLSAAPRTGRTPAGPGRLSWFIHLQAATPVGMRVHQAFSC